MDNGQSDKAASNRWKAWAQKESQRPHTTGTIDSHTTVHTSVPSPLPPSPSIINSAQDHGVQSSTNQLGVLLHDPPQCFCKKTAYFSYTLEYGPTLDCVSYDNQNSDRSKTTCGFHVHKISWDKMRSYIKAGSTVHAELTELRACPLYNYTFCNIFHLTNRYDKTPPHMLPHCYCGHPVTLKEKMIGGFFNFFFSCNNLYISGDIDHMCWYLDAKKVAFAKPDCMVHRQISLETYQMYQQGQWDIFEKSEYQHRSNLLAILSSVTPASASSEPTLQKTTCELQEEVDSLKYSLSRTKQDMKVCINRFKAQATKYTEKAIHLGSEREIKLRINGQQRLSEVEAELTVHILRSENQAKELEYYKAQVLEKCNDEDGYKKCKVCYSRDIEYILIPCFHYAYCGLCVRKLKECAICRKDIVAVHRVYNC